METEDWYPAPDKIYASNLALETTAQLQQTDIFPSVKEAVPATGKEGFAIENKVKLTFHPDFANEAELLKEKLATHPWPGSCIRSTGNSSSGLFAGTGNSSERRILSD